MITNFERHYNSNRAPFGFYVHAAWFISHENAFEAYLKFIDYLQTLDDVFISSATQVLDWVRQPVPLEELKNNRKCTAPKPTSCKPLTCLLAKGNEQRYMTSCADACPRVYPWCFNPLGV